MLNLNKTTKSTGYDHCSWASSKQPCVPGPRITRRKNRILFGALAFLTLMALSAIPAMAANWYVDPNASGANKGTSWTDAWTSLSAITGVQPGDTVYISGGSTSQTYPISKTWQPPCGNSNGGSITYQTGQDTGHNGMVIFDGGGTTPTFIGGTTSYVTLSGNVSGSQKMTIQNFDSSTIISNANPLYLTLSYIIFSNDGGPNALGMINLQCSEYYDIDHCTLSPAAGSSWAIYTPCADNAKPAIGFGINKIDYNAINLYTGPNGTGDTGIEWAQNADIYNNTIIGTSPLGSTTGAVHQDGIQASDAYLRIYNNVIQNMANAAMFLVPNDSVAPAPNHWRIYNNLCVINNSSIQGSNSTGIVAYNNNSTAESSAWNDIVIANNLISGVSGAAILLNGGPTQYTNTEVYNNIGCNSGYSNYAGIDVSSQITAANNLPSYSCGPGMFTSYQNVSGSGFTYDFHPTSGATGLIGQGANLYSYFTSDKDGNPRPATGAWDIGPYEVTGATTISAPNGLHLLGQ